MQYAFSTLELLFCLLIISIVATFALKTPMQEQISIRKLAIRLQELQQTLNDATYYAFLSKRAIDQAYLMDIMRRAQINEKNYSLILKNNYYLLRINNKQLKLDIRQNSNGTYTIGCNPNQILCRKIYHRKHTK